MQVLVKVMSIYVFKVEMEQTKEEKVCRHYRSMSMKYRNRTPSQSERIEELPIPSATRTKGVSDWLSQSDGAALLSSPMKSTPLEEGEAISTGSINSGAGQSKNVNRVREEESAIPEGPKHSPSVMVRI